MPSALKVFLTPYYQLPGKKTEEFLLLWLWKHEYWIVLNSLGTGLTNLKPTRPLRRPCPTGSPPAWHISQLCLHSSCSFTSPPPHFSAAALQPHELAWQVSVTPTMLPAVVHVHLIRASLCSVLPFLRRPLLPSPRTTRFGPVTAASPSCRR